MQPVRGLLPKPDRFKAGKLHFEHSQPSTPVQALKRPLHPTLSYGLSQVHSWYSGHSTPPCSDERLRAVGQARRPWDSAWAANGVCLRQWVATAHCPRQAAGVRIAPCFPPTCPGCRQHFGQRQGPAHEPYQPTISPLPTINTRPPTHTYNSNATTQHLLLEHAPLAAVPAWNARPAAAGPLHV